MEIQMNLNDIAKIFVNKNFLFMACNQPDIAIFFKPETAEKVNVCILINHSEKNHYSKNQLEDLYEQVERKLLFNGYRTINCHFIVLSDNIPRDRFFIDTDFSFWLIDVINPNLIIYDNQPDDFLNIKKELEEIIYPKDASSSKSKIKNLPIMTFILILINIIVFFVLEYLGSTRDSIFMLNYGAVYSKYVFENHEYYRLLTCIFLHFGSEHLFNNMITLGFLGNEVEKLLGHTKFLLIYLISGVGSSFVSALYYMHADSDSITISAGASGAIFGIFGSLLIMLLTNRQLRQRINLTNVFIIVVLSIINGFSDFSVDNIAHISGLMFGIILTFISCLSTKNVLQ